MKILIFNFFKTKHIQRSIFFFLILFTSINLSAQTKFTETFNNVKRGLSENDAAKTTQGTSGITYTRGPGTGIHKVANKDMVGCTIESLRSPSEADAWHHKSGYLSSNNKAIESFLFSKQNGQVARITHLF